MIPSSFVFLDRLPLTNNGKVDRRALPEPGAQRPDLEQKYAAPQTPQQKIIAEIWSQILGIERVGVHDDFFELGGHSLLATQVVLQMRNVLGVELPLRQLFEAPTVAAMSEVITNSTTTKDMDRPLHTAE
jgi:hypothetical protein